MRKTRLLSLVLIVSIMLMGAGYAYWTQDLAITSTVSTGDLDVRFYPVGVLQSGDYDGRVTLPDSILNFFRNPQNYNGTPFMEVGVNRTNNTTLKVSFHDLYPGAGGYASFIIVNEGTVPAMLNEVRIEGLETSERPLADYLDYSVRSVFKMRYVNGIPFYEDILSAPVSASTLEDFRVALFNQLKNVRLEPEEVIYINMPWPIPDQNLEENDGVRTGYSITVPTEVAGVEDDIYEDNNLTFDLKLVYQQQE